MRKHITSISILLESICSAWLHFHPIRSQSRSPDLAWVNEWNGQIFPIIWLLSYLESWYKDIGCSVRQITGANGVQMINPSPTAISSSSAAWPIYILNIYIQMKMACLVMEIGMQIMLPHHFVVCTTIAHSKWNLVVLDLCNYHVGITIDVFYKKIYLQDFWLTKVHNILVVRKRDEQHHKIWFWSNT